MLRIRFTYRFSAAIMVARTRLNVNVIRTLLVFFLLVWFLERRVIVPLYTFTFQVVL